MILPRRYLLSGHGPNHFVLAAHVLALADILLAEVPCEPGLAVQLAAQAWETGRVEYGPLSLEIR